MRVCLRGEAAAESSPPRRPQDGRARLPQPQQGERTFPFGAQGGLSLRFVPAECISFRTRAFFAIQSVVNPRLRPAARLERQTDQNHNMKNSLRSLLVLTIWLAAVGAASAQSTAFTYQGRLTQGGNATSGIYDLQFTIFGSSSGQPIVSGPVDVGSTVVSNGLFTVTLDFGAGVFTGSDRWLEIGVRTNGDPNPYTVLIPRQKITASPYAITAGGVTGGVSAGQLTGFILAGNIASGSISGPMLAAGSVQAVHLASNSVTTSALADDAVTAQKIRRIPQPQVFTSEFSGSSYGRAFAPLDADSFLVGRSGTQAVQIVNISGAVEATITPLSIPSFVPVSNTFGAAVAAISPTVIAVGDSQANFDVGMVFLFNSSGSYIRSIPNPSPGLGLNFGDSVVGVGPTQLLVAASPPLGFGAAGAAYLFSTNGTRLTTFTNPVPSSNGVFGHALAALNPTMVAIAAHRQDGNSGVVYLFNTSGQLVTTFHNPSPEPLLRFGNSLVAVGPDRLLIQEAPIAGIARPTKAYLFSTNGQLLTVLTNPVGAQPPFSAEVGVGYLAPDKLIFSAPAQQVGACYVFDTNGTVRTVLTNPLPMGAVGFGTIVTGLGSNYVLASSLGGSASSGDAYLFGLGDDQFFAPGFVPGLAGDSVRFNSIRTEHIVNDTITAEKIGAGAIDADKIADGAVTAAKIGGVLDSSQIPELAASKITTGKLLDAVLSSNVALLNASQTFASTNSFTNAANSFTGSFTGNGSGLTELNAVNISGGTLSDFRLSANVARLNTIQTFNAANTFNNAANSFTGNGSGLTALNAANISSGTLSDFRLPANVALLNTAQTFTSDKTFGSGVQLLADIAPASAPGVAFNGDADTGIFHPAANYLGLATGGAERLRVTDAGLVGIGETSPGARLDVRQAADRVAQFNRTGDDGVIVYFQRDGFNEGSITVAGNTVIYNAFTGSHYGWTDEKIERGTLVSMTGENRRQRPGPDGEIIYGVAATQTANDSRCLGAYLGLEEPNRPSGNGNPHQIMSVGNGEMWVTESKSGNIQPGDFLISAAVPGCAMKDDPAAFPIGHICARAAEPVDWNDVKADAQGVKRVKISVLFESFQRDSRGAQSTALAQAQQKRIDALETEVKSLRATQDRLARLEALLERKSPVATTPAVAKIGGAK